MIAIAAICKDEADLADLWVRHHLAEGIDRILVADASTDGTKDIFKSYDQVTVIDDTEPFCLQTKWMNELAAMAAAEGADFILASDVDEFWHALSGATIAEELTGCPHNVICATVHQHRDWNTKQTVPNKLPKIAFRWALGATLSMGNHEISGVGGGARDILGIRELQFRGVDHFVKKVAARLATLDPAVRVHGAGWHYQILQNKSIEELHTLWESGEMLWGGPTNCEFDPIPSHLNIGSVQPGMVP